MAVPGPPDVKTNTVSIIFEASISLIIIAPIDIGAIKGKVTYTNFRNGLAPSIAAAKKVLLEVTKVQLVIVKT